MTKLKKNLQWVSYNSASHWKLAVLMRRWFLSNNLLMHKLHFYTQATFFYGRMFLQAEITPLVFCHHLHCRVCYNQPRLYIFLEKSSSCTLHGDSLTLPAFWLQLQNKSSQHQSKLCCQQNLRARIRRDTMTVWAASLWTVIGWCGIHWTWRCQWEHGADGSRRWRHNIMQYNTTFFISVNKQKYMFSITTCKDISDRDKESSWQRERDLLVLWFCFFK